MKKARIMIAAIAVVAIVGGTLAFKASKNTQFLFFNDPNNHCTVKVTGVTTTDAISGVLTSASVVSTQDACPATYTTAIAD